MDTKNLIQDNFSQGGWFRYNKTTARVLGANAAIVLGNIIDKHSYFDDEVFFMLREDVEFETGLSKKQQLAAEKKLEEYNLIRTRTAITREGKKNYYRVNYDGIAEFLSDNTKTLRDHKQNKRDFYADCIMEVQELYEDWEPSDKRSHGSLQKGTGVVTKGNSNKTLIIRTNNKYTTKGAKAPKTVSISAQVKEVFDAYIKEVDAYYLPEPADIKYIDAFPYKDKLVAYIPYWNKYIGADKETQWRANTLDDRDKKNTAQLYVITRHWNKFRKYAEGQIEKKLRVEEGLV
jgi:hypothetical protein